MICSNLHAIAKILIQDAGGKMLLLTNKKEKEDCGIIAIMLTPH
jgi:hypothetical protein